MFKLLKPLGIYKPGKIFDSYDGLISGVGEISFTNTDYFKLL